ncbi:MAG: hypothetical protein OXP12_06900 [Thaumarchaeota archaeon]|nr:hypothetical protein [Nitrososphaerota archaeon]MDE0266593.1 hypothetical protein [Nitrososphaerota archaeon]MDE0526199.1 hypothetical protein [Nitrososphaerota archaeon]
MNQMVQYVLIFGVAGVFFAALYQGATDDVGDRIASHGDRLDLYKAQAAEHLKLVEITDTEPATADLVNTGIRDVRIRHLYVDGVKDDTYSVRDKDGPVDELRIGSLVRITSALDGGTVSIVTESGRVFRFGQ